MLVYWLDIVGTAVFVAISGVLLAGKYVWTGGVTVLKRVAVGGGTIRDMALDGFGGILG